ncbi:MAG: dihydrolipoyl dehydrogenase family protein, partial [Mycobacteriales bacterium]
MAQREFDVVVIGAGPAGENAAGRAADNCLSVAIVERELVGGECSYWACIPSKTLLRPGELLAQTRRVPGLRPGEIDLPAALARRDQMVSSYHDAGQLPWLTQKGIELIRGHARLDGPRVVAVSDSAQSTQRLTARRAVVIATGSLAAMPEIDGLAAAQPWDNRKATAVTSIPRRFLVLGGGSVGAELAQAYRRLGSAEVSLVEAGPRLLGREEPFAGEELARAFAAEGIAVHTAKTLVKVARSREVKATLSDGTELVADELLVAAGRVPRSGDLGLESIGLEPGGYIRVDDQLRACDVDGEWLYAVGDVNGRS